MRVIKVNGKAEQVFVLKETEEKILYIPIKYLHRVDYDRLIEIEKSGPKEMLEAMKKTKLSNGRNALVQYDNYIQVISRKEAEGQPKARGPGRPPKNEVAGSEKKEKRGPGRPPKVENDEPVSEG